MKEKILAEIEIAKEAMEKFEKIEHEAIDYYHFGMIKGLEKAVKIIDSKV